MSEVRFSAGGKEYTVACADGEEAHVAYLGSLIDAKLQQLGGSLSPQESQNLLFASLFLADELHEARTSAASAQEEFSAREDAFVAQQRDANIAIGQRDELKQTVARLEEELSGLQSALQRQDAEADDIRTELEQRREEAAHATDEAERLTERVNELERERNSLTSQISAKDTLLERANAHMDELKARLSAGSTATASAHPNGLADDPDLAPALERFAELLENCADKLEAKAASA